MGSRAPSTCCARRSTNAVLGRSRSFRAASGSGWCSSRCSPPTSRSCCSTSPTTSWISRASAGSSTSSRRRPKTILFVTHDREFLAAVSDGVVTLEGFGAWTHPGKFASYDKARRARHADSGRRARSLGGRGATPAAVLPTHEAASGDQRRQRGPSAARDRAGSVSSRPVLPRRLPRNAPVNMRLHGSRTGERVLVQATSLELAGLTEPFDIEIYRGDRVAVLGPNGSGKSHFLRLLGGDPTVDTSGVVEAGCRRRGRAVPPDRRSRVASPVAPGSKRWRRSTSTSTKP